MITAYLFSQDCPPSRANVDKAGKVSVKTVLATLEEAEGQEWLRCSECLEAVSLVHRDGKLNHFRHHPRTHCRFRSVGRPKPLQAKTLKVNWGLIKRLKEGNAKLQRELEQARTLIAHLTEENAQSRQELEQVRTTLANVNLQLGKVEGQLKAEEQEAHKAEEIILKVKQGLKVA
jgi:hypothetical protein